MTSDIFGVGIWEKFESPAGFRCGAPANFSKIQVSTITTSAFFVKSIYLFGFLSVSEKPNVLVEMCQNKHD